MALSFISTSVFYLSLCVPVVLSVPVIGPVALKPRFLPAPDPNTCLSPLVLCDRACCGSDSICGANGLCAPAPPPIPGQLWLTYTNDDRGRPCIINIHGRHFNTTADLIIQTTGLADWWSQLGISTHNFDINTGVQDCNKVPQRVTSTTVTKAAPGTPANVYVWDDAYIAYTEWFDHSSAIPVRITQTGVCP